MVISFSDDDLQRMPGRLREKLLAYVSEILEQAPTQNGAARQGPRGEFAFAQPPLGARKPRKLVSFTRAQGMRFLKMLDEADQLAWSVLGIFVRERIEDKMSPTDLAGALGLKNKKTGEWDARLVSPYLKKITHAVRRFTGNKSAGWYTIDPQGMFYLDPKTVDALRHAFETLHEAEISSESSQ